MQPFSSTCEHLSDVTSNFCLNETEKTSPSGKLGKFTVTVQSAVTSFFSSLSPNYIPEYQRQIRQSTVLVASTVPAENKNDKTSLADHVVRGVGLASKALSCWIPNVSAVSDAVGTICSSISLVNTLDTMAMSGKSGRESASRADNVPKIYSPEITNTKITNNNREDDQPDKSATTSGRANPVSGPAMTTVTLMAMDQLAGAAARPAEGEPGSQSHPILVKDSATLGKIGQPGYPPDAHYLQTQSFSHNSGRAIDGGNTPFMGYYDGGCHTIEYPQDCVFTKLGNGSFVHDLHVARAAIENSDSHSAALACEMGEQSTISDIFIEDIRIINNRVSGRSYTGVITGLQQKNSLIAGVDVKNSSITTKGNFSPAGIGAGIMAGQIEHLTVTDSWVKTRGRHADAGIGGGKITGFIGHLTVLSSNVSTAQYAADAGIGGGEVVGDIRTMTVVKSWVTTKGNMAYAGIGGGKVGTRHPLERDRLFEGSVNDLVALDSHVRTTGNWAHADIGGGVVNDEVRGVSAINCSVSVVSGEAGIDAGFNNAGSAVDIRSLNSRVNGELQNFGSEDSSELCRSADSRFVTDDCQLTPDSLTEDHWNCSATSIAAAPAGLSAIRHSPFPQPTAASVNNIVMTDITSQQPVMTPLNTTTMANTVSLLSSQAPANSASLNKTAMAHTTRSLSSQAPTSPASLNKTAMTNTASLLPSPALTSPASFDKTAIANTLARCPARP